MITNSSRIITITTLVLMFVIGIVSAITPTGPPMVDFTGTPTIGPAPLTVDFTSTVSNISLVKGTWNFGDGWFNTTLTNHISHTYTSPGKYTVSLEMSNLLGTMGYTLSKTDYIYVTHVPPVAGFTFTPHSGNAPLEVAFHSTTTGFNPELSWDFGDGNTGSGANPVHTYTGKGDYTITLNATNDGGSDTTSHSVTVLPPAPTADFKATSSTTGPKPFAVGFENQSTYDGVITDFSWQFGDGGTSTEQDPLHVYTVAGIYNVTLTISSPSGSDSETKDAFVTVLNEPVVCPTPIPTTLPTACPTPSPTETPTICPTAIPTEEPTVCPTIEPTVCPTQDTIVCPTQTPNILTPVSDTTGVYRPGVGFYLKTDNGNTWNPGTDIFLPWDDIATDRPISGDWNGDGLTETGVYRPGFGFYLKMDHTGIWNPLSDKYLAWDNAPGELPISGNWNTLTIATETGVYRPGAGFYLKMDNGSTWDPSTDQSLAWDNAQDDHPTNH